MANSQSLLKQHNGKVLTDERKVTAEQAIGISV